MRPELERRGAQRALQDRLVLTDQGRLLAVLVEQLQTLLDPGAIRPEPERPLVVQAGQILRPGEQAATQRLQGQTLAEMGDRRH
jgi:hypothetical protein